MNTQTALNQIDHLAIVIDKSASMSSWRRKVVEVVDKELANLAVRSKELNREIRVTVYVFNDTVQCLFYDTDVLRVPSIAAHYQPNGNTALIDATIKSMEDLRQTAQLYGDHAFLTYVFTDGEENRSRRFPADLQRMFTDLRDNETVVIMVPNQTGVHWAKTFGFPAGNISTWDVTTERGIEEGFTQTVRSTYDSYVTMRQSGVRSTRNLFQLGNTEQVNSSNIRKAGMRPLAGSQFVVYHVNRDSVIKPFVEDYGHTYKLGKAFYQLVKREKVQAAKDVLIRHKTTKEVLYGAHAREVLGLPDHEVPVAPGRNPEYDIFIQSTSVNRKLPAGTDLIWLL